MPCTYTGSLEGDRALAAQEALDRRERMLCALCGQLETQFGEKAAKEFMQAAAHDADGLKRGDIRRWWRDHLRADRRKR